MVNFSISILPLILRLKNVNYDFLVATRIPFSAIHKPPLSFESSERKCFQPGQRVHIEIIDTIVPQRRKLIHSNM